MKKKFSWFQFILSAALILVTITMVWPLLNILAISLSDPIAAKTMGGLDIFPKDFSLVNYKIVLANPNIIPALRNSIFVSLIGTIINVLLTTMAAYALTKKDLPFRRFIMVFLIFMMLFDPGLIPEYLTVQKLGLMGSRWSVILVGSVNVYFLFILMRYFEEIPQSLYEAAKIDGAGHLRTLFQIAMPLAKSGVAVITMFYGVLRWNEYFKAGIYILDPKKTTFPVILREFLVLNDTSKLMGTGIAGNYELIASLDVNALKFAAIIISIIPILLVYPIILRYYTKDALSGGVKE